MTAHTREYILDRIHDESYLIVTRENNDFSMITEGVLDDLLEYACNNNLYSHMITPISNKKKEKNKN